MAGAVAAGSGIARGTAHPLAHNKAPATDAAQILVKKTLPIPSNRIDLPARFTRRADDGTTRGHGSQPEPESKGTANPIGGAPSHVAEARHR